jgi:hypothetical protein
MAPWQSFNRVFVLSRGMKASSICARIFAELYGTPFPIVAANENTFELDGVTDVGETEGDGTSLKTFISNSRYRSQSYYLVVERIKNCLDDSVPIRPLGQLAQSNNAPVLVGVSDTNDTSGATLEVALQHTTDHIDLIFLLDQNGPFLALEADVESVWILIVVPITGITGDEGGMRSGCGSLTSHRLDTNAFKSTTIDE